MVHTRNFSVNLQQFWVNGDHSNSVMPEDEKVFFLGGGALVIVMCPPPVGIGLTDQQNIGGQWPLCSPPPVPASLKLEPANQYEF